MHHQETGYRTEEFWGNFCNDLFWTRYKTWEGKSDDGNWFFFSCFGRLNNIFRNLNISCYLKIWIFESWVLLVATYSLESLTLPKKSANRLRVTLRAMERNVLKKSVKDKFTNQQTKVRYIFNWVAYIKWQSVGNITRQDYRHYWYNWFTEGLGKRIEEWIDAG